MTNDYNADQISVLKGLETVRKNVGMYVGDSDKKGLHHLVWEVIDNSIDETMAGYCDEIAIYIAEDGETISISDNGRGIPVDRHKTEKKSALEVVLTTLHAGGKFEGGGYSSSGGLHGVGVSCVNALSDSLIAEIRRDGFLWRQEYSRGNPKTKVQQIRKLRRGESTGTTITLHGDPEIFKKSVEFQDRMLVTRLQEMAFLNPGLSINYCNDKTKVSHEWKYSGGLADYLKYLLVEKECYPNEPIYGEKTVDLESRDGECSVKIALSYAKDHDDEVVLGFTNNIHQSDGGTHISGFKTALTRAVNQTAKTLGILKEKDDNLSGQDVREGLHAIISIRFPRPEFTSQTKSKLGQPEAESVVSNVTYSVLTSFFEKNAAVLKEIVNRAQISAAARTAAKKSADLIKRKGFLGKSNRMPGKLFDCRTNKRTNSELWICEGDSAAGGAKDGRDPEFQAVLPIRGKIINVEKQDISGILKNKEIQALITAIGTGIKDEFDYGRLRYNKVIIMADADDDGSHIATLLMTFFYRYMKPLVAAGHIYLAQPPLFCFIEGSKKKYAFDNQELQNFIKGKKNPRIVRFKGLGEMDADQLGDTTMDPNNRHLIQLSLEDAISADRMVDVLMGSNSTLRKEHISQHRIDHAI